MFIPQYSKSKLLMICLAWCNTGELFNDCLLVANGQLPLQQRSLFLPGPPVSQRGSPPCLDRARCRKRDNEKKLDQPHRRRGAIGGGAPQWIGAGGGRASRRRRACGPDAGPGERRPATHHSRGAASSFDSSSVHADAAVLQAYEPDSDLTEVTAKTFLDIQIDGKPAGSCTVAIVKIRCWDLPAWSPWKKAGKIFWMFLQEFFFPSPFLRYTVCWLIAPACFLQRLPKKLDGQHVVFGKVLDGMDVVHKIEAEGQSTGVPKGQSGHS